MAKEQKHVPGGTPLALSGEPPLPRSPERDCVSEDFPSPLSSRLDAGPGGDSPTPPSARSALDQERKALRFSPPVRGVVTCPADRLDAAVFPSWSSASLLDGGAPGFPIGGLGAGNGRSRWGGTGLAWVSEIRAWGRSLSSIFWRPGRPPENRNQVPAAGAAGSFGPPEAGRPSGLGTASSRLAIRGRIGCPRLDAFGGAAC